MNFYTELIAEIIHNYNNRYTDNYDYYRFGNGINDRPETATVKLKNPFAKTIERILERKNFIRTSKDGTVNHIHALKKLEPYLQNLEFLFDILSDEESKKLLIKLIAFRILKYKRVKLPLNTPEYWNGIKEIEKLIEHGGDTINVGFLNWKLERINLREKNIPLQLYLNAAAVFRSFILKQYEYKKNSVSIKAKTGDYIIDAGGCWGDTALYFANEAGENGKVFTSEFIPGNINILKKNLELNPAVKERIILVNHPVWDISGMPMYYKDNGPGSQVFLDKREESDHYAISISIDDWAKHNDIEKIDFIKMDIEGAELHALKGAMNTIKKFKPQLAIAIYHSMEDFVKIPEFIYSLDLGYKFYLGHFTIHTEETILFATVEN